MMKYNILLGILLIGIFSVMFMPISTVIALHTDPTDPDDPGDGSHCHGEPKSPWKHTAIVPGHPLDVNGNGFECINDKSGVGQDDLYKKRN